MKTPFLWSGSKDSDYKKIKGYIPSFNTYYEPFLGGGSVYFRLLAERGMFPAKCTDVNKELINVYEEIRDNPDKIISLLPETKNKEIFNQYIKDLGNTKTEQAARFLYLNRNRFFGLGGWMNADRYARNAVIERIKFFSPLMQKTEFSSNGCWNFKLDDENSFVFCDPPYPDTNNTACYKLKDTPDEILKLNLDYLKYVIDSGCNFFWVTKYIDEINNYALSREMITEKKEWSFRNPQKEIQYSFELYIFNKLELL